MIISSPFAPQSTAAALQTLQSARTASDLPLAVGESIEAVVLGHDGKQTAVLKIKNAAVTADSEAPLLKGERLTLRVEQLEPSLVLKITSRESADTQKINEFLKMYRSNPDALRDWILTAKDILGGAPLKTLAGSMGNLDLQALLTAFNKIIITRDGLANPLFLKDYIESLGLALEKTLRKALTDPAVLKNEKLTDNLKTLLMKTEAAIRQLPSPTSEQEPSRQIQSLLRFVETGSRVIEQMQIVNSLTLDQDRLLVFQLPLQCHEGIRMQDIFIEKDSPQDTADEGGKYRIVLFLDMDALGEMVCDATMKNKQLSAVIKTENRKVCDFLAPLLAELRDRLSASGYDCGALTCVTERRIAAWKRGFLGSHHLFSHNTINISI